jgi:hypothetical protein
LYVKFQQHLDARYVVASLGGHFVPFAAGRGEEYPARKLTLVTGNKVPLSAGGDRQLCGRQFCGGMCRDVPKPEVHISKFNFRNTSQSSHFEHRLTIQH